MGPLEERRGSSSTRATASTPPRGRTHGIWLRETLGLDLADAIEKGWVRTRITSEAAMFIEARRRDLPVFMIS